MDHPPIYLSEFLTYVVPYSLATAILVAFGSRRINLNPESSQEVGGFPIDGVAKSREPMTQKGPTSQVGEIKLRPVSESDLPILFEHQQEQEANEMAAFPARDHDAFRAHWKKIMADRSLIAMTAFVDSRIAGHIGSWTQDGQRQVGYWIGKDYWGKGVATQVLSIFLRIVTDRPIHAYVEKHNVASIRVLEKCGFLLHADFTSALGQPTDGIEELVYVNSSASS